MNPIKLFYIGNREEKRGVLTVATYVKPDNFVDIAFAFCSPKDNFNRKTGRQIALDNLFFTGKKVSTVFSGHSSDDVVKVWKDVEKPRLWMKRRLVNVPETGLTFAELV